MRTTLGTSERARAKATSAPPPEATLIAGRYRVERSLAHGGMGEVFVAVDEPTGKRVALKRLLPTANERVATMFEREYHTLASLRHPRIIEVFDYGVEQGRAFYTMELLDGQDLRHLAPMPYKRAARYLRDVASSLALLHARRLVHRDVSPRNVRVTSDDRCKLIDFGALASFGIVDLVVGTPPYVPPEALLSTPLDQRADLFSLGALAYWLLTNRQAFPAQSIHDLPELWRTPPRPPSMVFAQENGATEFISKEMDDLVMSLLTPEPLGRPSSAGEVIARLVALGDLEPERELLSARSYLHGGRTVGRGREQARTKKRLKLALHGRGGSMMLRAPTGMGSTRLLSEAALEAQLTGLTPVVVDAKVHRGIYGVAHALVHELLMKVPRESAAAAAAGDLAILTHFSPALGSQVGRPSALGPLPPGELRGRIQHALACFVLDVAAKRPLLLAVDDLQRADEASCALLATLAREGRGHSLLLFTTCKTDEPAAAGGVVRSIEGAGKSLSLRGLTRDQVQEMLRSVFGPTEHIGRLSEWMQRLSDGNPRACMDLVHHLVDTGVIRFVDGTWVLPHSLEAGELPASPDQALDARLARLTPDALSLACALSVHRGPLLIDHCMRIAASERLVEPHRALEELTREEVLVQNGSAYHFVHDALRQRLYGKLDADHRKALHRSFGITLFERAELDVNARLDAGFHLLYGGEETKGADVLAEATRTLMQRTDDLAAAVPALRAALAVYRREGRPKHDIARLLGPLAMAAYAVDRRLAAEYGDEAMALLGDLTGIHLASRLRPWLGVRLSLFAGLAVGFVRALVAPRGARARRGAGAAAEHQHLLTMFFSCAAALTGTSTICLDRAKAKRYADMLEPLSILGPDHPATLAGELARTMSWVPLDRAPDVVAGCARVIARLEDQTRPVRGLDADSRRLMLGGAYYAMGAMYIYRDGPAALECADKLDSLGLQLYAMAAAHLRAVYHGLRGDADRCATYFTTVETHAIQLGSGWQVEISTPSHGAVIAGQTHDVLASKRAAEALDRLSKDVPSLAVQRQTSRAAYLRLAGDAERAHESLRVLDEMASPRSFLGWAPAMGNLAAVLLRLGRPEEAKAVAERALSYLTEADEPYIVLSQRLHVSLALAEAALGDSEGAARRIDVLLERHGDGEGPVILGNFHAARARIAIFVRDFETANRHVTAVERWFRPTRNPSLIAHYERLQRELRNAENEAQAHEASAWADASSKGTEAEILKPILACRDADERAQRALSFMVSDSRAADGYLFLLDRELDGLRLAAPLDGRRPPEELERLALDAIRAAKEEDKPTSSVLAAEVGGEDTHSEVRFEGSTYRLVVLTTLQRGMQVAGVAALRAGQAPVRPTRPQLLSALAWALDDNGENDIATDCTDSLAEGLS